MKKLIEVTELISALKRAGMEAGTGISGSSSYPLVTLAGGIEIWGYIQDKDFVGTPEEDLLGTHTINSITKK